LLTAQQLVQWTTVAQSVARAEQYSSLAVCAFRSRRTPSKID
jgi:hypothetical protein